MSSQREKKGSHDQSAGMQMVCPKMSIVGKATSIRGSQEEFPIGGTPRSGMEKGGEGAEFDHQEGAAAQL